MAIRAAREVLFQKSGQYTAPTESVYTIVSKLIWLSRTHLDDFR